MSMRITPFADSRRLAVFLRSKENPKSSQDPFSLWPMPSGNAEGEDQAFCPKAGSKNQARAVCENGVAPKFDPIVMRGFVRVSGWFRCHAERRS